MTPAGPKPHSAVRAATIAALALLVLVPAFGAAQLNYFEWSAVAPIVVAGNSLGENGRYVEVEIWRVLRGEGVSEGEVILVDLKYANRNRRRSVDPKALRLLPDNRYLLLLEPGPMRGDPPQPTYRLTRGVRGARELAPEGAEAMVDVLVRLIEIHDLKNDAMTWERLGELLEETNPLLIGTALEQFEKFRRGEPELMLTLRPLLDHPEAGIREKAARVIAQMLGRYGAEEIPEAETLRSVLISLARRDLDVRVRVAGTEALAGFPYEQVRSVIEEVASSDPDQGVRYAAEKIMLEHRQAEQKDRIELTRQSVEAAPN